MEIREKQNRIDSVTGMRGIACICIVCFHFYCLLIDDYGLGYDAVPWVHSTRYFFEYSKNAVELFFMLSGFLTAWHYRERIREMSFGSYFKKRYGRLLVASLAVNLWALVNIIIRLNIGLTDGVWVPTPLRFVLSVLMINTGWFTSFKQTLLPVNTTMWFIDVLLLCYLIYYVICRLGKNTPAYIVLCTVMVVVGWICLEHTPQLPFLWMYNGRGYATFFLGALLAEFQASVGREWRSRISLTWIAFIAVFFIFHMIVGFEQVFGKFGTLNYVRYFEFVVAPGLILAALNLRSVERILSWKALTWLGALSPAVYYVHNNWIEDCMIVNALAGEPFDLRAGPAFLIMLTTTIAVAMIYRKQERFCYEKVVMRGFLG